MIDDPKLFPFDAALALRRPPNKMENALCNVHDTMEFAKDIFAQQRITDYTAGDLVFLVQVILEREEAWERFYNERHRRIVAGEEC